MFNICAQCSAALSEEGVVGAGRQALAECLAVLLHRHVAEPVNGVVKGSLAVAGHGAGAGGRLVQPEMETIYI